MYNTTNHDESTQYLTNEDTQAISLSATSTGEENISIQSSSYTIGETLLNLYRVSSLPYTGGMGSVFRVHHTTWNVDLAVKQPHVQSLSDAKRVLFIHECEAWINLGLHPNIVACYYVRNINGIPSIFSEWMDDGSLKEKIASSDLYKGTPKEVLCRIVDILIQAARGIAYAHSSGLVHQDIKPANILCGKDGSVKIADFGLANVKKLIIDSESSKTGETTLAANGGYTLQYCSPEQLKGQPVSVRSDIWSWAVTALEMFVGSCKWNNGPIAGFAFETYLNQALVRIPTSLKNLLSSCFQENAENRPHDFKSIIQILLTIYQEVSGQPYWRKIPEKSLLTAEFLNNKALSYVDLGKPEEAEIAWKQALNIVPNQVDALFNYTLFQWRNGILTDSEVINKFTILHEQNKHAYAVPLAEFLCESGRYASAQRICAHVKGQAAERVARYCGEKPDDFSIIKETKITSKENMNIHETGIQIDPKDQSILACEIIENGNIFYRMRENEDSFHIEKELFYDDIKENIIHFVFTNGGKQIWVTRANQTIDILDSETYELLDRIFGPNSNMISGKYVIQYALSNKIGDLVAFVGITTGLTYFKMIWNVREKQMVSCIETESLLTSRVYMDCFFLNEDVIYLGDSILYFNKERQVTQVPIKESSEKASLNIKGALYYSFADFAFSIDNSYFQIYKYPSGQCINTVDTENRRVHPFGIFEDRDTIFFFGNGIVSQRAFSRQRYHCEWRLSGIISSSDAETFALQFKTLFEKANSSYIHGDFAKALEYVDEAASVPGYSNNSELMELNRKIGKHCITVGFRGIDFAANNPFFIKKFPIDLSSLEYPVFDREQRIILYKDLLLDIVTGKAIKTNNQGVTKIISSDEKTIKFSFGCTSPLLFTKKSRLCSYLESKFKDFWQLLSVLDDGEIMLLDLANNTLLEEHESRKNEIEKVCFKQSCNNEKALVTVQNNGTITKWSLIDGSKLSFIENAFSDIPRSFALSSNGVFLAFLFLHKIQIWNIDQKRCCFEQDMDYQNDKSLCERWHSVKEVLFFENNKLLTCSDKGQIIIWDIAQNSPEKIILLDTYKLFATDESGFDGFIQSCSLSPNQRFLIASGVHFVTAVDLQEARSVNQSHSLPFNECTCTAEKNTMMFYGCGNNTSQFVMLNWKYEFPGWADWDDQALPLVKSFLREYENPTEENIDDLMLVLQNKDLGWLRKEGIKNKIIELQGKPVPTPNKNVSKALENLHYKQKLKEDLQKANLKRIYRQQGLCEHCGGQFKGFFKKTCSICGKPKSY